MKKIFTFIFLSIISIFGYCDDFKVLASSDLSEQSNIPKITKGENDRKTYQLIQLQNGLRALLISDPNSDKAAASMRIFSGSFDDPDEMPGVAHFTEHMLYFSGKPENYGQYENYIKEHSETENASTSSDSTLHYFEIGKNNFIEALNQFSKLFDNEPADDFITMIEKEKNAVDSEHKNNLSSDLRRRIYVNKATANTQHPYSRFGTGNLETLNAYGKEQLVNAVKTFMKEHYVANNMLLTLYSPETIAQMQSLVVNNFKHLESGNPNDQGISEPVYRAEDLAQMISIQPNRDKDEMYLSFPIEQHISQYKTKPARYIRLMLCRKDQGSLYEYLTKQNWIEGGVSAGLDYIDKKTSMFSISFTLTTEGLKNYTTIIEATFAWLKLITDKGIEKWRFDEMQSQAKIQFDQNAKASKALEVAKSAAQYINLVEKEDLLISQSLWFDFNDNIIRALLAKITPLNMRIQLVTKKAITDKTEQYYQVPYKIQKIDSMLLKNWNTPDTNQFNFELRGKNKYIKQLEKAIETPANITVEKEKQEKKPKKLIAEDNIKAWIMPDDVFGNNQINVTSILLTTKFSDTISHFLLGQIYATMLNEYLGIKYANAIDALNSISINCTKNGIVIALKGYALEALTELLEEINHDVLNFVPEQSRFEVIKDKLTKKYSNDLFIDPDYRIIYESQRDFEMGNWSFTDRIEAIPEITFQSLQNFSGKNSEALSEINLEAFIYGNIDKKI